MLIGVGVVLGIIVLIALSYGVGCLAAPKGTGLHEIIFGGAIIILVGIMALIIIIAF